MLWLRSIRKLKTSIFDCPIQFATHYAHRPQLLNSTRRSSTPIESTESDLVLVRVPYTTQASLWTRNGHAYLTLRPLVQYSAHEPPHTTSRAQRSITASHVRSMDAKIVNRQPPQSYHNWTRAHIQLNSTKGLLASPVD